MYSTLVSLLLLAIITRTCATKQQQLNECMYSEYDVRTRESVVHGPKPDGTPCNASDVCGRHYCSGGNCTESIQFKCDLDGTDRVKAALVLLGIAGAMLVALLAILLRGGELASSIYGRHKSQHMTVPHFRSVYTNL